ncbi:MAG: flagellar protein FliT [Gammaproteobacteria bacterium]|nr:flagellar protein FliT [Gammaproteobacteria bacterium]
MAPRQSTLEKLDSIIDETKQYDAMVEQQQWSELNDLANKRQKTLEEVFQEPIDATVRQLILDRVEALIKLDKAIRAKISQVQKSLSAEVIDFASRSKAAKKYQQVENGR